MKKDFVLAVITAPDLFQGEAALLGDLLAAGADRLHIRKPGANHDELEDLLQQLPASGRSRVVLHGSRELAFRYRIGQVHGPWSEGEAGGLRRSSSLHSWEEVKAIPAGILEYAFISPLFDSISKPGYAGAGALFQCPAGPRPFAYIGLGGICENNIGLLPGAGWDGAAVLGWIWEKPEEVLDRYQRLKKIITNVV